MASPFSVFRKNSKGLMVALVGLSMFAFILMGNGDPTQEGSGLTMVLMIVCLGAGIAWGLGQRQGKGSEWASIGALVGAVIVAGFWLFRPTQAAYVETTAGNLSRRDVRDLMDRRQLANEFIAAAYRTKIPVPTEAPEVDEALAGFGEEFLEMQRERNLRALQGMWQQTLNSKLFGFGQQLEDDVIFGYLLDQEADELGIAVSDAAVTKFIHDITGRPYLDRRELDGILARMKTNETQVYDAIRGELRAQQAAILLRPRTYTTPQEYWDYYKRFTVTQSLATTAIPVKAFVDDSVEPPDAEIEKLFAEYQAVFPGQRGPGEPGFRQPPKVRIGYFAIDSEKIEKEIDDPTDEEIGKHYEDNKALYIDRSVPDLGLDDDEPSGPLLPLPGGSDDTDSGDDPDGDAKPDDAQPDDATSPDGSKPNDTSPDNPSPDDSDSKDSPDTPTPDAPSGDDTTDSDESSAVERNPGTSLLSVSDDEAVDATDDDDPSTPDAPAPGGDSDAKGDDTNPKGDDPDGSKPVDPADGKGDPEDTDPGDTDPKDTDGNKDTDGKDDLPDGFEKPDLPPPPKYKPLEEVRDDIIEALRNEAVRERVDALTEKCYEKMTEFGLGFEQNVLGSEIPGPRTVSDLNKAMTAFARELGIDYVSTPRSTGEDFNDSGDYAISDAREIREGRGGEAVLSRFFTNANFLFQPVKARSPIGDKQFVAWQLAHVPQHAPMLQAMSVKPSTTLEAIGDDLGFTAEDRQKLFPRAGEIKTIGDYFAAHFAGDVEKGSSIPVGQFDLTAAEVSGGKATSLQLSEPGIRDQVVETWREQQARPKAEERARALAKLAEDKPTTDLAIVYGEETVTGDEDGQELEIRITPRAFSWMNRSIDLRDRTIPVRPSNVPGLEEDRLNEEFLEAVFEDIENDAIGVVPNADRSIYYVVKVRERSPKVPLESDTHRDEFMSIVRSEGNPRTGGDYTAIGGREQQGLVGNWVNELRQKKYELRVNRNAR